MNQTELYFRNIARRWKRSLGSNGGRVLLFSPYITSSTAETVLEAVNAGQCEIHTIFSAENFANGSSSLRTLKKLLEAGNRLYHLPGLHAKVVVASGTFGSVGSQNLTVQGTRNREASVVFTDGKDIEILERMAQAWLPFRSEISVEMIGDMEKLLPPLLRKFRAIQRDAIGADEQVFETEKQRQDERERARFLMEWERMKKRLDGQKKGDRLRRLHESVKRLPKSSKIIYGYARDGIFVPRRGARFTRWIIENTEITLQRLSRYVAILPNTGKIGWVRVAETRLSRVESSLERQGDVDQVQCGSLRFRPTFTFHWRHGEHETNLSIRLQRSGGYGSWTLQAWLTPDSLEIVERDFSKLSQPQREELETWLLNHELALRQRLLVLIFAPFRYDKNLTGKKASAFFNEGAYRIILQRTDNGHPFLVAEPM